MASNGVEVERIIDLARSEVKRWGGDGPTLTHVAYVVARTWPEAFSAHFDRSDRGHVEQLLRDRRFLGDEATVRELLTTAPDLPAAMRLIGVRLGIGEAQPPAADPSDAAPGEPLPEAQVTADPDDGAALSARTAAFLRPVAPSAPGALRRPAESADIAAHLLRPDAPLVAVVGDSGVGKTAVLREIAAQLGSARTPLRMWRLGRDTIVANPVASFRMVLDDLREPTVIVFDDVDLVAGLGTDHPDRALLDAIGAAGTHPHARLLLVLNRRRRARLAVVDQALDDALVTLNLAAPPPDVTASIVGDAARAKVDAAGLTLGAGVVRAALAAPTAASLHAHPGLALRRIDHGIGRALLVGAAELSVEHLAADANARPVSAEASGVVSHLRARVRGQDSAIERVAQRLALTRTGLDLRPQRPNGVFLFAGPTGVGKTELATQIAVAEYGSAEQLIRLDMSEYSHDWAVSRIAGPMPGYVGSDQPSNWLTTKVANMPYSVILLDEIEKAHPGVWNVFLQVFDAGRLTDSRGVTADFAHTVIVMTSNLGAREASSAAVGFGRASGGSGRQLEVIRNTMAPELLNRVDEVILFNPLSLDAIAEIAEVELEAAVARLGSLGWSIAYSPDVPRWLATTGYDPAYGGRHLQRNIEREFLGLLATAPSRTLAVYVDGDNLAHRAT